MGRRAIPKIPADLQVDTHLRCVEELPEDLRVSELFDQQRPLEIEIGSGKGLFLSQASVARPDINFVGIEVARKYARSAAARLATHDVSNALMLQGDAIRFFRVHVPPGLLAAVHVYFPDPWWKTKHRKRRVMNPDFVKQIESSLRAGGAVHFWTDVQEYFNVTLDLLANETSLLGPFEVSEAPPEHDLDYRTHFERRMRLNGQPVYRSRFRKPDERQAVELDGS